MLLKRPWLTNTDVNKNANANKHQLQAMTSTQCHGNWHEQQKIWPWNPGKTCCNPPQCNMHQMHPFQPACAHECPKRRETFTNAWDHKALQKSRERPLHRTTKKQCNQFCTNTDWTKMTLRLPKRNNKLLPPDQITSAPDGNNNIKQQTVGQMMTNAAQLREPT